MAVVPTKYGMFMEHTYLRPGVPPVPDATEPKPQDEGPVDREHGLNLKATVGRAGKLNDATFDKFKSLHEGDKYLDTHRRTLVAQAESRKKNTVELPFKAISPMKKSVGAGDYYGTIGGKMPHEPEHVELKKKKGEITEQPKGIYTSPAKKGSFGYIKTTLSERVGYKGVATEYEYQHDPSAMHEARKRAEMEAEHKARASDLPFKPANPAKKGGFGVPNTTISKGKGVAGEWEYQNVGNGPEDGKARKEAAAAALTGTPFRPSYARAGDRMNHIEYIHDPEAPKMAAERARKLEESKKLAATGAWRPNMAYKTDCVRSIVKMNIPR